MTAPIGSGRLPVAGRAPAERGVLAVPPGGRTRVLPPDGVPRGEDQLVLVRAAIETGDLARALELLDASWNRETADERAWYLRLWILVGQDRIPAALDLARTATGLLPGSAAVAYLHAALEHASGDVTAALEAALRAAASAPGHDGPEALLISLLEPGHYPGSGPDRERTLLPGRLDPSGPAVSPEALLNLMAAVLAGLVLLHPAGSERPTRPALLLAPRVPESREMRDGRRRFGWLAAGTVVAALWAARNPMLATLFLAGLVAWLSRPRGHTSS